MSDRPKKNKLSKSQKKKLAAKAVETTKVEKVVEVVEKPQRITPTRVTNIECKNLIVRCLAPVHIGNGETLKSYEYLYNPQQQMIYFLNESRWIEFLNQQNLIDEFYKYIDDTASRLKSKNRFEGKYMWEWLNERQKANDVIRNFSLRQSKVESEKFFNQKKNSLNDIVCHIALADGKPYIPGSSLKGIFRTAILYNAVKNFSAEKKQRYWQRISATQNLNLNRQSKICAEIISDLENEIFNRLDYKNGNGVKMNPQINDVLRGLSVSDAVCNVKNTVILQKVNFTTLTHTEKVLPLFRECIPANAQLKFTVALDLKIMQKIGIGSVNEILQMTQDFFAYNLTLLKSVFGGKYAQTFQKAEVNGANAFVGGGTGFFSKTLLYALAPSHDEAMTFAANFFDKVFFRPSHYHTKNDAEISPRTLNIDKLTPKNTKLNIGNIPSLFGLVKIGVANA